MRSKRNTHIQLHKTLKRKCKKFYGGVPSDTDIVSIIKTHNIENVEIILFFIDFLKRTQIQNILIKYYTFINGIDIINNNLSQKLDFTNNDEYRKLINEIIQWFMLDYNKEFINSILTIIKNTLNDNDFLDEKTEINQKYNILLLNVSIIIDKFGSISNNNPIEDKETIEINVLLRIILKILALSSVKENIMNVIIKQMSTFIVLKHTIICLLDYLISHDSFHEAKIRKTLTEYIEKFTYDTIYDNINDISQMLGNCAASLGVDVVKGTARRGVDVAKHTAQSVVDVGKNTAQSVVGVGKNTAQSVFKMFSH